MLPKSKRLNLQTYFKWVRVGQKLDTTYVRLFVRKGDNSQARIGIAVSAKIFKKASLRNKVKRKVSQVFEMLYDRLPDNINIVALPKVSILDVKSGDVVLELEETLGEILRASPSG